MVLVEFQNAQRSLSPAPDSLFLHLLHTQSQLSASQDLPVPTDLTGADWAANLLDLSKQVSIPESHMRRYKGSRRSGRVGAYLVSPDRPHILFA